MSLRKKTLQSLETQLNSLHLLSRSIQETAQIDHTRKDNYDRLMDQILDEMATIQLILKNLSISFSTFKNRDLNRIKRLTNSQYNQTDDWKERATLFKTHHHHTCQLCQTPHHTWVKVPEYPDREWEIRIEVHHTDFQQIEWKSPETGLERSRRLLVLCSRCHRLLHGTNWPDLRRDRFRMLDSQGFSKNTTHREAETSVYRKGRRTSQ